MKPIIVYALLLSFFLIVVSQVQCSKLSDIDRFKYSKRDSLEEVKPNMPPDLPIIIVKPVDYPIEQLMFVGSFKNNIIRFEEKLPDKSFKYDDYILITRQLAFKGKEEPLFVIRGNMGVYHIKN